MKRFSCVCLALALVAALGISPAVAAASELEEANVKTAAEEYLSSQMRKIYLYEDSGLSSEPQTLLEVAQAPHLAAANGQISEDAAVLSVASQQALASFAEDNEPELMASMERQEVSLNDMMRDLQCMEDMTAYKSHVYETQGFAYSYFDAQYHFGDVVIDGDYATAVVYEELNYQYDDCDEPSFELGEYNLVLVKLDGDWVVADVVSDDVAFMGYYQTGYNLSAEIAAYDRAMSEAQSSPAQAPVAPTLEEIPEENLLTAAANDIYYNKQSAANYALTYTSSDDDGSATPSFRNTRFHWFGKDCMNFCSQAVWAGFGGSNSWADIPAKNGMDTSGLATWWCTNTTGTDSWASCSSFRTYLDDVSSDSIGIVCARNSISGGTNTLPFTASELVGAVLHVEGYVNNVPTAKAHAVFVSNASGNTRDTVMVCSYNRCRKNVKLSSVCSVGGSTKAVEIMIPRSFKGGKPSLFVCGSVLNVINSQGTSRSLAGYSNVTASLSMTLLKPDGSTAKTWPATTGTSISGTYNNWNASGEWILKVTATTSTGATKTWYGTIRVVLK